MGARALLLSADDKVSTLLSESIAAACKLERSKDIFAGVEAITRDRFDLLLIDWQEPLEADFLLKTARDLKSNHTIFAVALVTPAQGREALESGADAILVKPFLATQAAEMLLPRLGIETLSAGRAPDSPAETANTTSEHSSPVVAVAEVVPKPAGIAFTEMRQPIQMRSAKNQSGLEPSPHIPSRRSRILSTTALVWPLIIVAALLAFDQWPQLQRRSYPRLAALLHVARGRMGTLPDSWKRSPEATNSNHLTPEGAAIPLTADLLSDYASPATTAAAPPESLYPNRPEDIDLASVEALPSSSRPIAPAFAMEPSRPLHEIPASLRFPPPADNVRAITPTGQLVAPGWSEAPIALPEAVSRALLEHQVVPQYPDQALKMGVDGAVVLAASIGRDGAVRDLKLVSGYLVLAHAAVDAVKQWRYKPYRRNGENVEIETFITVNFKRPPRG